MTILVVGILQLLPKVHRKKEIKRGEEGILTPKSKYRRGEN